MNNAVKKAPRRWIVGTASILLVIIGLPGTVDDLTVGWPRWFRMFESYSVVALALGLVMGTYLIVTSPRWRRSHQPAEPTVPEDRRDEFCEFALMVSLAIHARNLLHGFIWREERENVMDQRDDTPFLKRFGIEMAQNDRIREATEKLYQEGIELPAGEDEATELVRLIRDGKLERARGRFPLRREQSDGAIFDELIDKDQEAAKAVDNDFEKELSWPPGGCVSDS